ncbi:MAG: hypothetical protein AAF998_14395 [Bacteroidota bacterium]
MSKAQSALKDFAGDLKALLESWPDILDTAQDLENFLRAGVDKLPSGTELTDLLGGLRGFLDEIKAEKEELLGSLDAVFAELGEGIAELTGIDVHQAFTIPDSPLDTVKFVTEILPEDLKVDGVRKLIDKVEGFTEKFSDLGLDAALRDLPDPGTVEDLLREMNQGSGGTSTGSAPDGNESNDRGTTAGATASVVDDSWGSFFLETLPDLTEFQTRFESALGELQSNLGDLVSPDFWLKELAGFTDIFSDLEALSVQNVLDLIPDLLESVADKAFDALESVLGQIEHLLVLVDEVLQKVLHAPLDSKSRMAGWLRELGVNVEEATAVSGPALGLAVPLTLGYRVATGEKLQLGEMGMIITYKDWDKSGKRWLFDGLAFGVVKPFIEIIFKIILDEKKIKDLEKNYAWRITMLCLNAASNVLNTSALSLYQDYLLKNGYTKNDKWYTSFELMSVIISWIKVVFDLILIRPVFEKGIEDVWGFKLTQHLSSSVVLIVSCILASKSSDKRAKSSYALYKIPDLLDFIIFIFPKAWAKEWESYSQEEKKWLEIRFDFIKVILVLAKQLWDHNMQRRPALSLNYQWKHLETNGTTETKLEIILPGDNGSRNWADFIPKGKKRNWTFIKTGIRAKNCDLKLDWNYKKLSYNALLHRLKSNKTLLMSASDWDYDFNTNGINCEDKKIEFDFEKYEYCIDFKKSIYTIDRDTKIQASYYYLDGGYPAFKFLKDKDYTLKVSHVNPGTFSIRVGFYDSDDEIACPPLGGGDGFDLYSSDETNFKLKSSETTPNHQKTMHVCYNFGSTNEPSWIESDQPPKEISIYQPGSVRLTHKGSDIDTISPSKRVDLLFTYPKAENLSSDKDWNLSNNKDCSNFTYVHWESIGEVDMNPSWSTINTSQYASFIPNSAYAGHLIRVTVEFKDNTGFVANTVSQKLRVNYFTTVSITTNNPDKYCAELGDGRSSDNVSFKWYRIRSGTTAEDECIYTSVSLPFSALDPGDEFYVKATYTYPQNPDTPTEAPPTQTIQSATQTHSAPNSNSSP